MAKIYENEKGFLIIKMDKWEASSIGFGVPEGCICMHCNKIIPYDSIYYICVLNDTMCKECLDEFISNSKHYEEDIPVEKGNFDYYSNLLYME